MAGRPARRAARAAALASPPADGHVPVTIHLKPTFERLSRETTRRGQRRWWLLDIERSSFVAIELGSRALWAWEDHVVGPVWLRPGAPYLAGCGHVVRIPVSIDETTTEVTIDPSALADRDRPMTVTTHAPPGSDPGELSDDQRRALVAIAIADPAMVLRALLGSGVVSDPDPLNNQGRNDEPF